MKICLKLFFLRLQYIELQVLQVSNLDLAHNWVSSVGQIDKVIFFKSSFLLVQVDKKKNGQQI